MPPHKKAVIKVHITATITPEVNQAITNFQNDEKNWTKVADKIVMPTRSGIIQNALETKLGQYLVALAPVSNTNP